MYHGRRTLDTYYISLLSSQIQNYNISYACKISHLSEVKIVLFVVSIAYYAQQSIRPYRFHFENHISVCHGRRRLETYDMALLSSPIQNYYISKTENNSHLSEVKVLPFVNSIVYYAIQSICTYSACL